MTFAPHHTVVSLYAFYFSSVCHEWKTAVNILSKILCVSDKKLTKYRFRMTCRWVNNERMLISVWTVSLSSRCPGRRHVSERFLWANRSLHVSTFLHKMEVLPNFFHTCFRSHTSHFFPSAFHKSTHLRNDYRNKLFEHLRKAARHRFFFSFFRCKTVNITEQNANPPVMWSTDTILQQGAPVS